jgi:hypothetical protein
VKETCVRRGALQAPYLCRRNRDLDDGCRFLSPDLFRYDCLLTPSSLSLRHCDQRPNWLLHFHDYSQIRGWNAHLRLHDQLQVDCPDCHQLFFDDLTLYMVHDSSRRLRVRFRVDSASESWEEIGTVYVGAVNAGTGHDMGM